MASSRESLAGSVIRKLGRVLDYYADKGGELRTSDRVRQLAAKGLRNPASLTDSETAELCGSVMRHIEGQGKG